MNGRRQAESMFWMRDRTTGTKMLQGLKPCKAQV
jgi:hypothetical protein